jgi:hypothetical protein
MSCSTALEETFPVPLRAQRVCRTPPPLSSGYSTVDIRRLDIRRHVGDLGFALVRWPHPRGVPPAFEALAGVGACSWRFKSAFLCFRG